MTIDTAAWNLYTMSPIYVIYYNAIQSITVFDDRHLGGQLSMSSSVHHYLHYNFGT